MSLYQCHSGISSSTSTPPPPSLPPAMEILYWRDPRKTGVLAGSVLLLLVSLSRFSVLSVTAHVALAVLSVTISVRAYRSLLQALQKKDEGHPFR